MIDIRRHASWRGRPAHFLTNNSALHVVMAIFEHAKFFQSAYKISELPPDQGREVAFAGRSNAGKSSAINTLASHNRLAFVSKTPGRTQLINFFEVDEHRHYLVDLPGYGYAKVSQTLREHWQHTLATYLQTRQALCGMIVVMDCRHPLKPNDVDMLRWFAPSLRPVHILLSKADKLSRQQGRTTLDRVKKELAAFPGSSTQLFSSLRKTGIEEAEAVIAGWLEIPATAPKLAAQATSGNKKPPAKGE